MTKRLKELLIENMGLSAGPTKYAQLKEMLKIMEILPRERISFMPHEVIEQLNQWTDQQWMDALTQYRRETTALVKMYSGSLPEIRNTIAQSLES